VLLDVTQLAFAMDVANCHQPQLDSVGEHQTDPLPISAKMKKKKKIAFQMMIAAQPS
jgi:hypothetical protein